jgi:DNA-binding YbaB/EbfC family protein
MRGQIGQLMQQAQRMQEDMKRAQEEIAKLEVTGSAGGGLVSVTMSGAHEVRKVVIDRQTFADDPEMAEDLVAAAINDAVNKVAEASRDKMGGVTAGMSLPPGFKMPF